VFRRAFLCLPGVGAGLANPPRSIPQGALELSQAVCRSCWTWYRDGETMCKTCRIPLMSADAGAPAFAAGGQQPAHQDPSAAATGQPAPLAPAGANRVGPARLLLPIGGIVAIIVIAIIVIGALNLGGPATASDGSFSVKNPGGWYPTTFSLVQGRRVVLSLEARKANGTAEFAVVDYGQQVPIEDVPAGWERLAASGQVSNVAHLGGMHSSTVGGAPAMVGDISGTLNGNPYEGQLIFIDYNSTTYIVASVATSSLMDGDLETMLASWTWLH